MAEVRRIESSPGAPSVASAFSMLDLIAKAVKPITMIEVARRLRLPKSSVSRVLRTLEEIGAVARDPQDRCYTLGPKIEGYSATASMPKMAQLFLQIAGPVVRPLNETTQLGVLTGRDVRFAAYLDSTRPVRLVTYIGRSLPAHASAAGKAILAFTPTARLQRIIAAGLSAVTDNTITDPVRLRDELARIRSRGYAIENEESAENLSCIAAPVLGATGLPLAAITMCFPSKTIEPELLTTARDAVLDISASLSQALTGDLGEDGERSAG